MLLCFHVSLDLLDYLRTYNTHGNLLYSYKQLDLHMHRSLAKERPWAEHLTSLPKNGVGAFLIVFALNHKRASMSCLQHSILSKEIVGQIINVRATEPPVGSKVES